MSDIFKEVDEDVRRDKAVEAWTKHQNLILAVALLIVLATAGWRGWAWWQAKQAQEAGARYEAALQLDREGKADEAEKAFSEIARQGPAGYAQLGKLRGAAALARTKPEEAVRLYDQLAGDSTLDPVFRDLAQLRAAMLRLDDADAAEAARRLDPLAASGQPFRATARELIGVKALALGDYERAGKFLDMIVVDSGSPPSLRQRAELLLGLVRAGKPTSG